MKFKKTGFLVIAFIVVVAIWFQRGIGASEANAIAKSAFSDLATHMGKPVSDFIEPTFLTDADGPEFAALQWKSKSQPNCQIEVYVDRKYANARPIWICS